MAEPAGRPSSAGRREQVFQALRTATEPQTIASLAAKVHIHPNTVRFHLESLVAAGRARRAEGGARHRGRPALRYEAVTGMDPAGPRSYEMLAEILVDGIAALPPASDTVMREHIVDPVLDSAGSTLAHDAGRRWGRRRARAWTRGPAEDRLVGLLTELGFAPERRTIEGIPQIGLRHCPLLELAQSRAEVVCPVHLGLMRGAMETWGGTRTVARLEPFVEPDLCVAHLSLA